MLTPSHVSPAPIDEMTVEMPNTMTIAASFAEGYWLKLWRHQGWLGTPPRVMAFKWLDATIVTHWWVCLLNMITSGTVGLSIWWLCFNKEWCNVAEEGQLFSTVMIISLISVWQCDSYVTSWWKATYRLHHHCDMWLTWRPRLADGDLWQHMTLWGANVWRLATSATWCDNVCCVNWPVARGPRPCKVNWSGFLG